MALNPNNLLSLSVLLMMFGESSSRKSTSVILAIFLIPLFVLGQKPADFDQACRSSKNENSALKIIKMPISNETDAATQKVDLYKLYLENYEKVEAGVKTLLFCLDPKADHFLLNPEKIADHPPSLISSVFYCSSEDNCLVSPQRKNILLFFSATSWYNVRVTLSDVDDDQMKEIIDPLFFFMSGLNLWSNVIVSKSTIFLFMEVGEGAELAIDKGMFTKNKFVREKSFVTVTSVSSNIVFSDTNFNHNTFVDSTCLVFNKRNQVIFNNVDFFNNNLKNSTIVNMGVITDATFFSMGLSLHSNNFTDSLFFSMKGPSDKNCFNLSSTDIEDNIFRSTNLDVRATFQVRCTSFVESVVMERNVFDESGLLEVLSDTKASINAQVQNFNSSATEVIQNARSSVLLRFSMLTNLTLRNITIEGFIGVDTDGRVIAVNSTQTTVVENISFHNCKNVEDIRLTESLNVSITNLSCTQSFQQRMRRNTCLRSQNTKLLVLTNVYLRHISVEALVPIWLETRVDIEEEEDVSMKRPISIIYFDNLQVHKNLITILDPSKAFGNFSLIGITSSNTEIHTYINKGNFTGNRLLYDTPTYSRNLGWKASGLLFIGSHNDKLSEVVVNNSIFAGNTIRFKQDLCENIHSLLSVSSHYFTVKDSFFLNNTVTRDSPEFESIITKGLNLLVKANRFVLERNLFSGNKGIYGNGVYYEGNVADRATAEFLVTISTNVFANNSAVNCTGIVFEGQDPGLGIFTLEILSNGFINNSAQVGRGGEVCLEEFRGEVDFQKNTFEKSNCNSTTSLITMEGQMVKFKQNEFKVGEIEVQQALVSYKGNMEAEIKFDSKYNVFFNENIGTANFPRNFGCFFMNQANFRDEGSSFSNLRLMQNSVIELKNCETVRFYKSYFFNISFEANEIEELIPSMNTPSVIFVHSTGNGKSLFTEVENARFHQIINHHVNHNGATIHVDGMNPFREMILVVSDCDFKQAYAFRGPAVLMYSSVTSTKIKEAIIRRSNFTDNIAKIGGGAVFLLDVRIKVLQNNFTNNSGFMGGALYVGSSGAGADALSVLNNSFDNNLAHIGGAIFFSSNSLSLIDIDNKNNYTQNDADYYGNDIATPPARTVFLVNEAERERRLSKDVRVIGQGKIRIDSRNGTMRNAYFSTLTQLRATYRFKKFRLSRVTEGTDEHFYLVSNIEGFFHNEIPGDFLKGSIRIAFLDKLDQLVTFFPNIKVSIRPLSDKLFIEGTSELFFDDVGFVDFTNLKMHANTTQRLEVVVEHHFGSMKVEGLQLVINFRQCQPGENFIETTKTCFKCARNTFSFDVKQLCAPCPEGGYCLGGSEIQVREGYWRWSNTSTMIVKCADPSVCLLSETHLCKLGHIGALCRRCDIYGNSTQNIERKKYTFSDKKTCVACTEYLKSVGPAVFWFFFSLAGMLMVVYFTDKSASVLIESRSSPETIKRLTYGNAILKMIMNYTQLLTLIAGTSPEMSTYLQRIVNTDTSFPYGKIVAFLNCTPIGYFDGIPFFFNNFLLYIFQMGLKYLILMLATMLLGIPAKAKNRHAMKISLLFVVYLNHTADLTKMTLSMFNCTTLSPGFQGMSLDLSYQCGTARHAIYMLIAKILSVTVLLVLPMFILIKLFRMRNRLEEEEKLNKYSYLYREFKSQYCYWEIGRLYIKLILVIFSVIKLDNFMLKNFILLLLFSGYFSLLERLQPFKVDKLQELETLSIKVYCITIFLVSLNQYTENAFIKSFCYIVIVGLNGAYLYLIMKKLVSDYYNRFLKSSVDELRGRITRMRHLSDDMASLEMTAMQNSLVMRLDSGGIELVRNKLQESNDDQVSREGSGNVEKVEAPEVKEIAREVTQKVTQEVAKEVAQEAAPEIAKEVPQEVTNGEIKEMEVNGKEEKKEQNVDIEVKESQEDKEKKDL